MNAIFYDVTGAEIGRASFDLGEPFKVPMGTFKAAVWLTTSEPARYEITGEPGDIQSGGITTTD